MNMWSSANTWSRSIARRSRCSGRSWCSIVGTDACRRATCDSSAIAMRSRNRRCTRCESTLRYQVAVALSAVALQFITRGPEALFQTWCDALSAPYIAALGVAAAMVAGGSALLPSAAATARLWRFALLGVAGALAGAALLLVAPACARGPFGTLDPIVVTYWYANVREGLPVWHELDSLTGFSIAPSLVGLIGSIMAWRRAEDNAVRHAWAIVAATLAGTFLLSLFVLRTASTAQMTALPGCAWVGLQMWTWARSIKATVPRILASLLCAIALPPAAGSALALVVTTLAGTQDSELSDAGNGGQGPMCVDAASLAALNALPPTILLTPLDVGPHLLQRTGHSVVATGHHRNNVVMARTISTFIGRSDQAESLVRASGATMIVACPTAQEFDNFRSAPGQSLAEDLAEGRVPAWLEPVPLGDHAVLKAWRLRD